MGHKVLQNFPDKVKALPSSACRFGFFALAIFTVFFSCTFHLDKDPLRNRARRHRKRLRREAEEILGQNPGSRRGASRMVGLVFGGE